jgi:transcription initiation factor TFIIH subunit 3
MSAFITETALRPHLNIPTQRDVDFRAACFLTNKIVEIGYVCSVCLCITSQVPGQDECPMCGTKYELSAIAALKKVPVVGVKKKKKKKKLDGASTPGQLTEAPTPSATPTNGV